MELRFLCVWIFLVLPAMVSAQGEPPASKKGGGGQVSPPSPSSPAVPSPDPEGVLRKAQIERKLSRLGFVVIEGQGSGFREFYLGKRTTRKFITTDMVWDLYQRFLSVALFWIERSSAEKLREFSRRILSFCRGKKGKIWRRLFLISAPASAFFDPGILGSLSPEDAGFVRRLLDDVKNCRSVSLPLFSLPRGIDTREFQPAWIYRNDKLLSAYWKSLTWYRALSLDLHNEKEKERETALFLTRLIFQDPVLSGLFREMERTWAGLIGPPVGLNPDSIRKGARALLGEKWRKGNLALGWRGLESIIKKEGLLAFPLESTILGKDFQVFPLRWSPGSLQLCRDCWPLVPGRILPSGMDWVAVGPVASETGKALFLEEFKGAPWVKMVLSVPSAPLWDSFYCKHFPVLEKLLEPCKGAPRVFFTPAWRAKQVWTQLGCIAGLRRNFQLHLPNGPSTGIIKEFPPALSPYPGFYKGVGELLDETAGLLSRNAVRKELSSPKDEARLSKKREEGIRKISAALHDLAGDCRRLAHMAGNQWSGPGLSEEEDSFLQKFPVKWYGRFQEILPKALEGIFKGHSSFILPGWIGPKGSRKTFYYGNRGPFVIWILLPRKGRMVRHVGMVYAYQEGIGPKGLRNVGGKPPTLPLPRFTRKFLVKEKRSSGK